jgi:hypothetical protein
MEDANSRHRVVRSFPGRHGGIPSVAFFTRGRTLPPLVSPESQHTEGVNMIEEPSKQFDAMALPAEAAKRDLEATVWGIALAHSGSVCRRCGLLW